MTWASEFFEKSFH